MQKDVKVIFEGEEEILKTIDSEGEIVNMLGLPSEKCALIGSTIKLATKLGKGAYGSVFEIEFPGMGEKTYVVKKSLMELEIMHSNQEKIEKFLSRQKLSWDEIRGWQTEDIIESWENANYYTKVKVIIPPKLCLRKNRTYFPIIPINGQSIQKKMEEGGFKFHTGAFEIPEGSYICESESFSELVTAVYAGKLYRDGICANFFNTYSMFTCLNSDDLEEESDFATYHQYTFMDKIDGDLNKYKTCIACDKYAEENKRISSDIINGIYVQSIFAIAAYQQIYNISHNDLHTGNLFVEFVTPKTIFNNKKVADYDYYHYSIEGKDIYIPAIPVLAKIGDFGLSVKYKKPVVGRLSVFEDGVDTGDGTGPYMSNLYIPQYDSLFFTTCYALLLVKDRKFSNATQLLQDCIKFICPNVPDPDILNTDASINDLLVAANYIKPSNARPVLENLRRVETARDILLKPILQHYSEKPKSGKIITLGEI